MFNSYKENKLPSMTKHVPKIKTSWRGYDRHWRGQCQLIRLTSNTASPLPPHFQRRLCFEQQQTTKWKEHRSIHTCRWLVLSCMQCWSQDQTSHMLSAPYHAMLLTQVPSTSPYSRDIAHHDLKMKYLSIETFAYALTMVCVPFPAIAILLVSSCRLGMYWTSTKLESFWDIPKNSCPSNMPLSGLNLWQDSNSGQWNLDTSVTGNKFQASQGLKQCKPLHFSISSIQHCFHSAKLGLGDCSQDTLMLLDAE